MVATKDAANNAVLSGTGAGLVAQTAAQQAANIEAATADLQDDIDAAETALVATTKALKDGTVALAATATSAAKAYVDSVKASAQADLDAASARAAANAQTSGTDGGAADENIALAFDGADLTILDTANSAVDIATYTADGGVELVDGVTLAEDGATYSFTFNTDSIATINAAKLDALIAAMNDQDKADAAETKAKLTAETAAVNAIANEDSSKTYVVANGLGTVNSTTGVIDYDAIVTAATGTANAEDNLVAYNEDIADLAAAEKALATFATDVAAWEALRDLDDELTALEKELSDGSDSSADATLKGAVLASKEAIENATDDADAPGLGVTLIDFGADFGALAEDELTVYSAVAAAGNDDVANFGAAGTDSIYFGEGYTLVEVDADAKSQGDVAALEILWEQDGADLILYIEEETFAGNSATAFLNNVDITTITLTGVDAADVTLENGYLSVTAA